LSASEPPLQRFSLPILEELGHDAEMEYRSGQMLPLSQDPPATAPVGRKCATEDCETVLSRYNPSDYCAGCKNPRRANRTLMRIVDEHA
jgi:hypothetical protein